MIKVWRVTKWLSVTFVLILTLLLATLAFALFTNTGLNAILWGANQALPELKVESTKGALFPRFTLNNVAFKDESLFIDLAADSLTLAVDLNCLSDPRVCVNELAIQGLDFSMPEIAPSEPSPEPSEPLTSVSTPIPIAIGKVNLANINLDILGTKVSWERFTTSLSMTGSKLSIGKTLLATPTVALPLTPDKSETTAKNETSAERSTVAVETSTEEPARAIELPEVLIPLFVNITRLDIRDFTLQQEEPIIVHHLGLQGFAGKHDVHIESLELAMPQVDASLSGNVALIKDYPLDLVLDAQLNETDLAGQKLALTAKGSVGDLQLNSHFSGVIDAVLSGDIQPLEPTLPFDLVLSKGKAAWPLKGESEYQVIVDQLKAKGSLEGYEVALKTQASGTPIPDVDVELQGKGDLKQINLETLTVDSLGGSIQGAVMANWEAPVNWKADIMLSHIQPGLQWPEAEGDISGQIVTSGALTEAGGWQVKVPKLDIVGVLRDYPLLVKGQLEAADQSGTGKLSINTDGLSLAHGPNNMNAKGSLHSDWDMNVAIDFPDIAKTVPELQGLLVGTVALKGKMQEPDIRLDVQVKQAKWQQEASIDTLSLSGAAQPLPIEQANADLRLQASGIQYQDQKVDSLDVTVQGTQAKHELNLDLVSTLLSAQLKIVGNLVDKPSLIWTGELASAHFETEQGPVDLQNPIQAKVDIDKQRADVSAHCWKQSESRICLEKDIQAGASGEALVTLKNFNFEQIKSFIPEQTRVEGSANATVWAKWAPETSPEVKVDLKLPKGQVTQELEIPLVVGWESIELKANLANDQLDASWLLDVTDNGDLSGKVTLPNVLAEDKQIDGELNLSTFNLDFLQPIVGEFNKLKANLSSTIQIKGDALHPQLYGDFKVEDLSLKGDISPIEVDSGGLVLSLNGYDGVIDAKIQTSDGELLINGDGNWQDLQDWRTKLRIFAEELKVDVPPMVKVKVVPDMTIEATPKLAKVTGSIGLPWGRIVVEELPPSAVAVSSDQVILNADLTPLDDSIPVPFNIETDISISIGNDFTVSAFGLKGDLRGKLHVSQKDKGPFIQGEVNIVNGSYSSFGQDLLIDEGKILMTGPVDQPYVNIKAIRNPDTTADDVTAGVKVTGLATEPKIEIFSDPTMPQANALSYLLRGQDIDGETGGNALTTTLIGLSLAKSGKVVGEIGQAFGVQDLQLDTAGSGDDSQVTVSGYVLPGLQVKYGVGIFNSLGEFTVRYRIIEDFYVEAVSGLYSSVVFLYQFEVD
ncbi:autotransporter assembly complex protein TamB [Vibrio methylphosphonaticus]|uniref:autotransporter assembly complex protein TamB n=1 Tax=Vibrio methylphosphonaticus TaxID=2946866 RepID=UPI00202A66D0|nr:translocation/assembly module TamB domain-containing protein [Vibrio methylphosphonaticus]MCL9777081.1 translocation/assembly module TamB [Vibrio methylphosphonaticus]